MSKLVGNILQIQEQPSERCFFCGKMDECRPYGPNEENGCYECLMSPKYAESTLRKYKELLAKATKVILLEGGNQ